MKEQKNNTKNKIIWPRKMHFTIDELFALNPQFNAEITLRVRITGENGEIVKGKVAEIGCIRGQQGRPQKVYALTPITKIILEKAKADGIDIEQSEKLFNVMSVKNPPAVPTTLAAISV